MDEAIHPYLFPPAVPETKPRKRLAKLKKAKKMNTTTKKTTTKKTAAKKVVATTKAASTPAPAKKKVSNPKPIVAKKVPVKKATPATKKTTEAAAPAHRTDYKAGARVKVQRKNGEFKGFVTKVFTKKTGTFIEINIGTKQVPILHQARPAAVRGF